MADLTVTAASVLPGTASDCDFENGTAGEALTAGQSVYKLSTDSKFYKADANADSTKSVGVGVALNSALVAGSPVRVQKRGKYTCGATVTVGAVFVFSATAGGIAPVADLTTGWYTGIFGVAASTTEIYLNPFPSGYAVAP